MKAAASRCAGVALLVTLAGPACRSVPSRKPEAPVTLEDPHHHVVDVSRTWVMENPNEGFSLVEVPALAPGTGLDASAPSPDGRVLALATCEPGCRVLVRFAGQEVLQELRGPVFSELRPFSGLVWLGPDILVFDQWTQPHYGIHYAVDVRNGWLLQASPFPDRLEE